ncbi:MAG TPA: hypothetical protein VGO91_02750 [Pyrinomonadaceae bacterium]|jgi:hypothetical protein|nr:hypothetical protein [Pyrinomonadaceae bacterium]
MQNRIKILLVLIACIIFAYTTAKVSVAEKNESESKPAALALPQAFPTPVISSNIPTQVTIPAGVSGPVAVRPYFDYFSWQSFVALNWQVAMSGGQPQRGQPSSSQNLNGVGMRVWQSYKADWETFRPQGAPPTDWNSYALNPSGATNPCGGTPSGAEILPLISKMDSVIDGFNQAFSGPLIDQQKNYVRYEIHLNEVDYNTIVNTKWYIFSNVSRDPSQPNVFPWASIEVKAAWKILNQAEITSGRFFTMPAQVVNPGSQQCQQTTVGLVGFHIANKVAPFREWVWSTFEHVDNVPVDPKASPLPNPMPSPPPNGWSFNNGTSTPATTNGYSYEPSPLPDNSPLPPSPTPVQVVRFTPITYAGQNGPTTDQINAQWRAALSGTVWQNYELVATQWPSTNDNFQVKRPASCPNPSNPMCNATGVYPQNADNPFPAQNVANTTMETYFQNSVSGGGSTCMQCHYGASQDDFTFLLAKEAYKPPQQQGMFMAVAPTKAGRKASKPQLLTDPILEDLRRLTKPTGKPQTTRPKR